MLEISQVISVSLLFMNPLDHTFVFKMALSEDQSLQKDQPCDQVGLWIR